MDTLLLAAVLAVLILIAVELSVLIRRFDRLPSRLLGRQDKKDGPTINVNVGTVSTTPGVPGTALPLAPTPSEPEPEPEEPEEAPPEPVLPPPPPKPSFFSRVASTPSGLGVIKCPKCEAENSSFRSECFQCGSKL